MNLTADHTRISATWEDYKNLSPEKKRLQQLGVKSISLHYNPYRNNGVSRVEIVVIIQFWADGNLHTRDLYLEADKVGDDWLMPHVPGWGDRVPMRLRDPLFEYLEKLAGQKVKDVAVQPWGGKFHTL